MMWYLFGLFGLAGVWGGLRMIHRGSSSRTWPMAEGKVLSHETKVMNRDHPTKRSYMAVVHYEYEVQGDRFVSDRRCASPCYHTAASAHRIHQRYPIGSTVTVYYDPLNFSKAVLEPGAGLGAWIVLGLGIVMASLAALGLADLLG